MAKVLEACLVYYLLLSGAASICVSGLMLWNDDPVSWFAGALAFGVAQFLAGSMLGGRLIEDPRP